MPYSSFSSSPPAPINITNYPEKYQELFGVQEAMFTVSFTGRQSQGLVVSWFKNGIQLFDSDKRRIVTVFSEEERTGNTSIHFPQMKRDDGAVYRVLVKTEFGGTEIEDGPKRDDESFQVEVVGKTVLPENREPLSTCTRILVTDIKFVSFIAHDINTL